jgi:hypothetical protein
MSMKHQTTTTFRLPQQLLEAATETARQRRENLSAILRRHLEAYASTQPTKTAK